MVEYKYIEYLASELLKDDYSNLYKLLARGKSLGALVQLLSYVTNYASDENCIRTVAFRKVEIFAKKLSISKQDKGKVVLDIHEDNAIKLHKVILEQVSKLGMDNEKRYFRKKWTSMKKICHFVAF